MKKSTGILFIIILLILGIIGIFSFELQQEKKLKELNLAKENSFSARYNSKKLDKAYSQIKHTEEIEDMEEIGETGKIEEEDEEEKIDKEETKFSKIPEDLVSFVSVSHVIDGDTIVLSTGEKVRYIGIDTPELNKLGAEDDECLAVEARLRNAELLKTEKIILIKDPGVDKDKYGRLLRYAYSINNDPTYANLSSETLVKEEASVGKQLLINNSNFVNAQLVQEGFAKPFFCQPEWKNCPVTSNKKLQQIIMKSFQSAQNNKKGLFSGVCNAGK